MVLHRWSDGILSAVLCFRRVLDKAGKRERIKAQSGLLSVLCKFPVTHSSNMAAERCWYLWQANEGTRGKKC